MRRICMMMSAFMCLVFASDSFGSEMETVESGILRLQEAHRLRHEEEQRTLSVEERAADDAHVERYGEFVGALEYLTGPFGNLSYLSGHDLRIPVKAGPGLGAVAPTDAAGIVGGFLAKEGSLFGVDGTGSLELVSITAIGSVKIVQYRQSVSGFPVFRTHLSVVVNSDGTVGSVTANLVPERFLPSNFSSTPVGDILDHKQTFGWFHPALFSIHESPSVNTVLATQQFEVSQSQEAIFRYLDATTGETLFVERVTFSHQGTAPVDTAYSPDGVAFPGSFLKRDSIGYCAQGTYPNCTYWPGSSVSAQFWTSLMRDHLASTFGRDSWDNGSSNQQPTCPYAGVPRHRMQVTSDWNAQGSVEAKWDPAYCAVAMGTGLSDCYDVYGHEFGHAVTYADINLDSDWSHSNAMIEGFADIQGELFEAYLNGQSQPDWRAGSGFGCVFRRNLENPHESQDETGTRVWQPDHASDFAPIVGWNPGDHFNSTVISKLAYLLGRPSSAGSVTHWGIPVTGIGIVDAGRLLFDVMTTGTLLQANASLSHFRSALLYAASARFGSSSNQYLRTVDGVDAMGYWTGNSLLAFSSSRPSAHARMTVSGQDRRYLFTIEGGYLGYRYRTCSYFGTCTWSSRFTIGSGSRGVSAAVHEGVIWVVWDYNGSIRFWRQYGNGTSDSGTVPNSNTDDAPSVVSSMDGTLHIFIRTSPSLDQVSVVKMIRRQGTNWLSVVNTPISSRSPVSASSVWGLISIAYRGSDRGIRLQSYDTITSSWGSEVAVMGDGDTTSTEFAPALAIFRGRLHFSWVTEYPTYWFDQTHYMSCQYPDCGTNTRSHAESIDPMRNGTWADDHLIMWVSLLPEDGKLYRFDFTPGSPARMNWRYKNSQ